VRIVAGRAVLAYRGVLEQHRSAHLGVTARAQLVHRAADLEVLDVADRPVRVVTRRARHLAFANRHVGDSPLGLHDLQPMTGDAQLGFGGLCELMLWRLRIVNAVACGAREIPRFVHAAFPTDVITAVVTREARLVDLGRLDAGESFDVSL